MEEFNFASERVRELIMRLEGIQFFCAVAIAAGSVKSSPEEKRGESTPAEGNAHSAEPKK